MEDPEIVAILLSASLISGFGVFWFIVKLLPRLEQKESLNQKADLLKDAKHRREELLSDASLQTEEHLLLLKEELETLVQQTQEDLKIEEDDLASRELSIENEEKRLQKIEASLQEKIQELATLEGEFHKKEEELANFSLKVVQKLETASHTSAKSLTQSLSQNVIDARQLECQKVLKSLHEELSSSSRKLAQRSLDRVHSRYAPDFVWPKPNNFIEIKSQNTLSLLQQENCTLINNLKELAGINIQVISGEEDKIPPSIKVVGGYGIYREATRLTLEEILERDPSAWGKVKSIYDKYRLQIEAEAVKLGKKAVVQLQLDHVHPEIQKLVGALNWRTSYRQNQWHHTVEVAVLAGIIASELGVDPEQAKRVGMLHDIGKAIDYRIEGSHAVISGDYADRYGESRLICDTVMSHHADLLVESPLAYVLRAADTLSGARPGARVNLEEGYQIRISAIYDAVTSFQGIIDIAIMNGGREVHIQVDNRKVAEQDVQDLTKGIARKIETDVAYPGQIKVLVTRTFESVAVA